MGLQTIGARLYLWWFARGNKHRVDDVIEEINRMNSAGEKAWWSSSAIWGGIVAVVAPIAVLVGRLAGYTVEVDKGGLASLLATVAPLLAGLGGLVAIHGRVIANTQIKQLWGPPRKARSIEPTIG